MELFSGGDKCLKCNEMRCRLASQQAANNVPKTLSLSLSTYHLGGILHRLCYLNCHRPKSCVCHQGGEIYSKFHRDTKLHSSIFTSSSSTACVRSIWKFQLWWHEADDDDYNGDNNQKLCENNEMHASTNKIKRNYFNQFNFHFINDLIISPETVKCTRLLGIFRNFDFLQ